MKPLPPTVHGPLVKCAKHVFVDGLRGGADVTLRVRTKGREGRPDEDKEYPHEAVTYYHYFDVEPLAEGQIVTAKQQTSAEDDDPPWSPEVTVGPAVRPPLLAAPRLPDAVGACSHVVRVDGVAPGCRVVLSHGPNDDGPHYPVRCVAVDLRNDRGGELRAHMEVCGEAGPEARCPIVDDPTQLRPPKIRTPLFSCETTAIVDELHPGTMVELEVLGENGENRTFTSRACGSSVRIRTGELTIGDRVRARQFWQAEEGPCHGVGRDWSDPDAAKVESARAITPPEILEPLYEGDDRIHVRYQRLGADLKIKIRPKGREPAETYGPRPAGTELEIGLASELSEGDIVSVVQTLCEIPRDSNEVTVRPRPAHIQTPKIEPPLYTCGARVQVSNLHEGAFVRIYMNGAFIGEDWTGENTSIGIEANPSLVAGGMVTAKQWVGGEPSEESEPKEVGLLERVEPPRIMKPVTVDDTEVWVSRVIPGARVTIRSGPGVEGIEGETEAAEPIVRVRVRPVAGPLWATARLCYFEGTSIDDKVTPITDPGDEGEHKSTDETIDRWEDLQIDAEVDGEAIGKVPVKGQFYYPVDENGDRLNQPGGLPLVVIAHGLTPDIPVREDENGNLVAGEKIEDSYNGYGYLARHLASWGMAVFSLDLERINDATEDEEVEALNSPDNKYQYARARLILHIIDRLLGDARFAGWFNRERVGLVGHSMGGEAVVIAQHLNDSEELGYGIRGVVSIAPTNWRPEAECKVKYMQIQGSRDYLLTQDRATGTGGVFSGVRIYDRAWRPKTHFWILRGLHRPFNTRWPKHPREGLSAATHEKIAKCLINAFFQDALADRPDYAGYMQGTILPPSLRALPIYTQHSAERRKVLDNFGDADKQVGLGEEPLNDGVNSRTQEVKLSGADARPGNAIDEIEHTSLKGSPHDTKGVRLKWREPGILYTSPTGGLNVDPEHVLSLRIAQSIEEYWQEREDVFDFDRGNASYNPRGKPLDLFVTLQDKNDASATVRLGAVSKVPFPHENSDALSVMQTIRLPMDAFKAANVDLDLEKIASVTLELRGRTTGDILVDDLEFDIGNGGADDNA